MSNENQDTDTDTDDPTDSTTDETVESSGIDVESMPVEDAEDDDAAAADDEAEDADEAPASDDSAESDDAGIDAARVKRLLNYVVLGGLVLLAFVAGLQFYLNASSSISRWVDPEFRSLFQAAFNLAIFLLAAAGIFRQLRRVD